MDKAIFNDDDDDVEMVVFESFHGLKLIDIVRLVQLLLLLLVISSAEESSRPLNGWISLNLISIHDECTCTTHTTRSCERLMHMNVVRCFLFVDH